jgi:hypothetical protein
VICRRGQALGGVRGWLMMRHRIEGSVGRCERVVGDDVQSRALGGVRG